MVTREVQGLARLVGASGDGGSPRDAMRSGVLVDRLVAARREARLIVDGIDRYGELLRNAGVISAIGRAAIVLGKHGKRSRAEGVGERGEGERAVRRDSRLVREQAVVVIGESEGHRLAGLVGGASGDGGSPRGAVRS